MKAARSLRKVKNKIDDNTSKGLGKTVLGVSSLVIGLTQLPKIVPVVEAVGNRISALIPGVQAFSVSCALQALGFVRYLIHGCAHSSYKISVLILQTASFVLAFISMCALALFLSIFRALATLKFLVRTVPARPTLYSGKAHFVIYYSFYALLGAFIGLCAVGVFAICEKLFGRRVAALMKYLKKHYCAICMEQKRGLKIAFTHDHRKSQVCKECFCDYARAKLNEAGVSNSFTVCPLRDCARPLTERDLMHCHAPKKTLTAFRYFSALRLVKMLPCPKCQHGIAVTEEHRKDLKTVIPCTHCKHETALTELLDVQKRDHNVQLLMNMATSGGWQPCPGPNCGELVEKIDGCNMMTHHKCGTNFCYLCGMKLQGYQQSHFPQGSFNACVQKLKKP